jgi:hypothetical protein
MGFRQYSSNIEVSVLVVRIRFVTHHDMMAAAKGQLCYTLADEIHSIKKKPLALCDCPYHYRDRGYCGKGWSTAGPTTADNR